MKNFLAWILVVAMVFSIAACQGEKNTSVEYEGFISRLNELNTLFSVKSNCEFKEFPDSETEKGEIVHSFAINDTVLDIEYLFTATCNKRNEILLVSITATKGSPVDMDFALMAYNLYKAMDLRELELDSFFEVFKLLEDGYSRYVSIDGWGIKAYETEEMNYFEITKS